MRKRILCVALTIAACGCAAPNPYIEYVASRENLALGRAYTLDPRPNYPVPDGREAFPDALHDGVLSECDPARAPTLAWHMKDGGPVRIVFDLSGAREIQEIVLHVGAGRFKAPAKILVQTANSPRRFVTVATKKSMKRIDLPSSVLFVARFAGTASYVRIVLWPDGEYLVLDEVAIFPRPMPAK